MNNDPNIVHANVLEINYMTCTGVGGRPVMTNFNDSTVPYAEVTWGYPEIPLVKNSVLILPNFISPIESGALMTATDEWKAAWYVVCHKWYVRCEMRDARCYLWIESFIEQSHHSAIPTFLHSCVRLSFPQ
jgi:hypothetical protein